MKASEIYYNNNSTLTHEGGQAIKLPEKNELIKLALTSFLENTFYETMPEVVSRIVSYANKINDPVFLLKLSIFWRNYWLRSVNHLIFAIAITQLTNTNTSWKSGLLYTALKKFVWRPDDISNILSFYKMLVENNPLNSSKKVPYFFRKAIKRLIEEDYFTEYQLIRYEKRLINQKKNSIYKHSVYRIADIIRLTHPKLSENHFIVKDIIKAKTLPTLENFKTPEYMLSQATDKSQIDISKFWFKALLMYMNTLLSRWFTESEIISELKRKVSNNPDADKGLFPLDYLRVIHFVDLKPEHENFLISLAQKSLHELHISADTIVAPDVSWSMSFNTMSGKSKLYPADLALFYSYIISREFNNPIYTWDNNVVIVNSWPNDTWKSFYERAFNRWGWTRIDLALNKIVSDWYNKVIVFTDWQYFNYDLSIFNRFKQIIYFNLAGYENSVQIKNNIIEINGFTDIMLKSAI